MFMSIVEFPLQPSFSGSHNFPEPIVSLGVHTTQGVSLFDFFVDSGAELTILPKSFSEKVGINIHKCPSSNCQGIEGKGIKIYYSTIEIQIGGFKEKIKCAFANHDRVPLLLGRKDIFSRFNITFNTLRSSIIFEKVKK